MLQRGISKKLHIAMTLLLAVSILLTGTYAWNSLNQTAKNEMSFVFLREYGSLQIQKTVENSDGSKLSLVQEQMAFTFTVTFDDEGSYDYVIRNQDGEGEKQTLKSGETLQLRHGETAHFAEIPVGVLYNVAETPVDGYIATSKGHQGNITKDGAKAEFVNRCNPDEMGTLTITKELRGADEATKKEAAFTFTAVFDGKTECTFQLKHGEIKNLSGLPIGTTYEIREEAGNEQFSASIEKYTGQIHDEKEVVLPFINYYHETPPTDQAGSVTVTKKVEDEENSGDTAFGFEIIFTGEGSPTGEFFELKAGESKTVENIPHGVTYTVKETDSKGYWPNADTVIGKITGGQTAEAVIINRPADDSTGSLTISKEVRGADADYQKDFYFEIEVDGVKDTFKLKHGESKKIAGLQPGSAYTVKETNPYDEGYTAVIESYSGKVAGGETILLPFVNVHKSETDTETGSIEFVKEVTGEQTNPEQAFAFEVVFEGENAPLPMYFSLKAGESKRIDNLPIGIKYTAKETDAGEFEPVVGEIRGAVAVAEPVRTTFVNKAPAKETEEVKITVKKVLKGDYPESEKDRVFKMTLFADGKEENFVLRGGESREFQIPKGTRYEVREENYEAQRFRQTIENGAGTADGQSIEVTVTNTYVGVAKKEVEGDPPIITKMVKGKGAPKTKFQFAFVGEAGNPMPDGAENAKKVVTLDGAGSVEVGKILFTKPGTYKYRIYEIKEDQKGWTYDTARYTVTFVVEETDGKLSCSRNITKNSKDVDKVTFVNSFDQSVLGDNIVISGQKTWEHGKNPADKQPTSIVIKLYGNGKLKTQKQVTAADGWKYSFEVPKKDENGREIKYNIDETPVDNYAKTIDGYDVHNVYQAPKDEKPDKPDKPDKPGDTPTKPEKPDGPQKPDGSDKPTKPESPKQEPGEPVDTGDQNYLGIWLLILLECIGLMICMIYGRKQKLQQEGGTKDGK